MGLRVMRSLKTPSAMASPWPQGAVLLFSSDAPRLAELRLWVAAMAPGVTPLEARQVEDAAISGGSVRIALAVLDHAGARTLSPLVRLLRRHSPDVQVLVFSTDAAETPPQVTPWSRLPERLQAFFQRLDLTGLAMQGATDVFYDKQP